MKKNSKNIIIILLIVIIIFGIIGIFQLKSNVNKDGRKFKEEYESLNGKATGKDDKKYMRLSIDENNPVTYVDLGEALKILKNDTGVIYFGFPECPWCRNLVPVLLEAIKEAEYKNVYYCNALNDRDKKHLDADGKIIVDQEGSKEYQELLEYLYDKLSVYEGLNDDKIKRLYFPTVVFVKDGKVVDFHENTVDTQEDPYQALTEEQHNELLNTLITGIKKTQGILCTDDSKC